MSVAHRKQRQHAFAYDVGVFSEVYFPWGWKATVDGNEVPLARVNYILRALAIPAGSHEIVMTFAPESVRRSSAAAYCIHLGACAIDPHHGIHQPGIAHGLGIEHKRSLRVAGDNVPCIEHVGHSLAGSDIATSVGVSVAQ